MDVAGSLPSLARSRATQRETRSTRRRWPAAVGPPLHRSAGLAVSELAAIALPVGSRAPGAARPVTAHRLTGLVAPRVLHDAELLVSELVTNGRAHGQLDEHDTVLVRIYVTARTLRLEIENAGTAGRRHRQALGPRARPRRLRPRARRPPRESLGRAPRSRHDGLVRAGTRLVSQSAGTSGRPAHGGGPQPRAAGRAWRRSRSRASPPHARSPRAPQPSRSSTALRPSARAPRARAG